MVNNFQRPGAISNADVGSDFETAAQEWFVKGVEVQGKCPVKCSAKMSLG